MGNVINKHSFIPKPQSAFSPNAEAVVKSLFTELMMYLDSKDFRNGTVEALDFNILLDPNEEYLDYGKTRPTSREYVKKELAWYLSKDPCIKGHEGIETNPIWSACASDAGRVNSNYGRYVYGTDWTWPGGNTCQFEHAVNALDIKRDTRQSVIMYNYPEMQWQHNNNVHAKRDFTCTIYTQHFIDNDNKLIYIVNMRSNDAIFGLQNDYAWHRHVYFHMFNELKKTYPDLEVGHISWHAGSIHVYERHYDLLRNIVKEYDNEK